MKACRACGIDVNKDTKNRHPLTDKDVYPTLIKFATSAVRSLSSPSVGELCLDVKKFEAGYICQRCYRQLTTLHTLQKKLRDREDAITSKVTKVASLLPTSDFPYPVGRDANISFPLTNACKAFFCSSFKV